MLDVRMIQPLGGQQRPRSLLPSASSSWAAKIRALYARLNRRRTGRPGGLEPPSPDVSPAGSCKPPETLPLAASPARSASVIATVVVVLSRPQLKSSTWSGVSTESDREGPGRLVLRGHETAVPVSRVSRRRAEGRSEGVAVLFGLAEGAERRRLHLGRRWAQAAHDRARHPARQAVAP